MPFDPKIIREPDDDGDEFPSDMLEELGAQLTADANHLANCYPSKRLAQPQSVVRFRARRWHVAAAVAMVLLAVVFVTRPRNPVATVPTVANIEPLAAVPSPVSETPPEVADKFVATYENLTGPEWEGVLDLLEQDSAGVASLSL
jgi:hypothetical protein